MEQQYKAEYEEVQCIGRGNFGKYKFKIIMLIKIIVFRCRLSRQSPPREKTVYSEKGYVIGVEVKGKGRCYA